MEQRYFAATVMAGRLWLDGPDFGYLRERQVDMVMRIGSSKVETAAGLSGAIRVSGVSKLERWAETGFTYYGDSPSKPRQIRAPQLISVNENRCQLEEVA